MAGSDSAHGWFERERWRNVHGNASHADVITGNLSNDCLVGWGGNDFIYADLIQTLDGVDLIESGAANDDL